MEKTSTYAYVILTALVGFPFWIALAASVDMDNAVTGFTWSDAVSKALHMPVASVLRDLNAQCFLWFLLSIALAVATLFLPKASLRIKAVLLAVLVSAPAGSLTVAGIAFPLFLTGGPYSGETWGEGWPVISAVGFWSLLSLCYVVSQWIVAKRRRNTATIGSPGLTDKDLPRRTGSTSGSDQTGQLARRVNLWRKS